MFPEADHLFWVCHGVNYLMSNYEEGLWTPLFPMLYEGNVPLIGDVTNAVLHGDADKHTLAWTIHDRRIIWVYVQEAVRRLTAAGYSEDVDQVAKRPHQPLVWEMFHQMRQKWEQQSGKSPAHSKKESPNPP